MDPIYHERAELIIEEPSSPFKRLFLSERGGMLVVEGVDGMGTEVDTIPSLSYFSAVVRQKLESMQCTVPLNSFCGMHTEPEDSLDGACGIMRSLTSQLLRQKFNFDLSFLDLAFVDKIRAHELSHLCLLFRNLLKSAKSAAIFCIIDGISRFDTEDKRSDVNFVMKYLQELDKDIATTTPSSESNGVFLHVLVTSPKPSQFSRRWIHTGQSIIMPAKCWWPRDPNI